MISGNVPQHLVVAARTGFLTTALPPVPTYAPIATQIDMDAKSVDMVDLGGAPMPLRNRGKMQVQDFIEKKLAVTPLDWDITVFISYNAVKDDQTGSLDRKVRASGDNFQRHISQQAFQALNDGDASTNFGAAYDGGAFYADAHIDKGANYQTGQDNKDALALSAANFGTVYTKAQKTRDDQGNFTQYNYDLLVVPPELETLAWQLTNVKGGTETITNANPYFGKKYIVAPQLDSTAWIVVASSENIKPIIIAMREQPNLQSAWFDPEAPDGGRYYFKFYARYNHFYGDWRLAYMGNS